MVEGVLFSFGREKQATRKVLTLRSFHWTTTPTHSCTPLRAPGAPGQEPQQSTGQTAPARAVTSVLRLRQLLPAKDP